MFIQTITKSDFANVDKLIYDTFTQSKQGYNNEVELINKIRKDKSYVPELELIALDDSNQIISYGLLSEVNIVNNSQDFLGLILAPLVVSPTAQDKKVVETLLAILEHRAKQLGYNYISILNHTNYSPQFGYEPASKYKVKAPFKISSRKFMIKSLNSSGLVGISGTLLLSKAFEK